MVPAYFAAPAKPSERPQEIFRSPTLTAGASRANGGINAFGASLPFTLSGGAAPWAYGYRAGGGWLAGYWDFGCGWPSYGSGPYGCYRAPFAGSGLGAALVGASAASMAGGGAAYGFGAGFVPGFGWGAPFGLSGGLAPYGSGYWGGWGGPRGGWGTPYAYGGPGMCGGGLWGAGPWGWYGGGLGAAALGASAAFGAGGAQTGVVTPTTVIQTAPSKPSGNYYAPSTADPAASGGYYATTAPAAIPMIPQKRPVTNFWGSPGSPLPKDINSVPWAK